MPSFKTKERARVSDTDINDLMDEGVYTFEAGFWSTSHHVQQDSSQDTVADFAPMGKGRLPVRGEITSDWLIS